MLISFGRNGIGSISSCGGKPNRSGFINSQNRVIHRLCTKRFQPRPPSLDNAREKCLAELIANSGLKNGVVAISDNKSSERLSQIWNNGKLTERVEYDSHTSTHAQYDAIKLLVENIAEYWEPGSSGNYYLTETLCQTELGKAPLS